MKRGTPRHPKTYTLAAVLNVEQWAAVGILESLWHFAQEYAQAGDVGKHTDEAIARAIGWTANAATLVSGLVQAGWLDRCICHRVRVHDWPTHADQTVERWLTSHNQQFLGCYDDPSTVLAESKLPSRAVPSLAKPSQADAVASAPAEKVPTWNQLACSLVISRYGGTAPGGRITKALRPLMGRHGEAAVLAAFGRYVDETEAEYFSPEKFATTFNRWTGAPARASPSTKAQQQVRGFQALLSGRVDDGAGVAQGDGGTRGELPGPGRGSGGEGDSGTGLPARTGTSDR